MSYDSSHSGDSFIDAIEEENGVSRMVIMGLTGLRNSLRVLAKMKGHSIYMTSCCFCLATVVLMPFVAFCSGLVWLISVCLVTV